MYLIYYISKPSDKIRRCYWAISILAGMDSNSLLTSNMSNISVSFSTRSSDSEKVSCVLALHMFGSVLAWELTEDNTSMSEALLLHSSFLSDSLPGTCHPLQLPWTSSLPSKCSRTVRCALLKLESSFWGETGKLWRFPGTRDLQFCAVCCIMPFHVRPVYFVQLRGGLQWLAQSRPSYSTVARNRSFSHLPSDWGFLFSPLFTGLKFIYLISVS